MFLFRHLTTFTHAHVHLPRVPIFCKIVYAYLFSAKLGSGTLLHASIGVGEEPLIFHAFEISKRRRTLQKFSDLACETVPIANKNNGHHCIVCIFANNKVKNECIWLGSKVGRGRSKLLIYKYMYKIANSLQGVQFQNVPRNHNITTTR